MQGLRNALPGLLVFIIGVLFFIGALKYDVGSIGRIGPGFVPIVVSLVTMVLGIAIVVMDIMGPNGEQPTFDGRSFLYVTGAIAAYAWLLESAGVLVSTAIAVFVLALSSRPVRVAESVLVTVCLSVFIWVVFSWGLKMPIYLLPKVMR